MKILDNWHLLREQDKELLSRFTRRELQIMELILRQKGYSEIARELAISYHTVRTHARNITIKSNMSRRELKKRLLLLSVALMENATGEESGESY